MSLPLIFPNAHLPYIVVQGLMRNRSRMWSMAEEPNVDVLMRHLQVCIEEFCTIADAKSESNACNWKVLYKRPSSTRTGSKSSNDTVLTPFDWLNPNCITPAPAPKKVEALMTGHDHCPVCKAVFEPDLGFCPACGAEK